MPKINKKCKSGPGWLTSFADLQQLLLVFFILLFSTSVTDTVKLQNVINSFTGSKHILDGSDTDTLVEFDSKESAGSSTEGESQEINAEQSLSEKKLELSKESFESQALEVNSKEAQILENKYKKEMEKIDPEYLEEVETVVEFLPTTEGVLIRLKDKVLFDSGSAVLKEESRKVLLSLKSVINNNKNIRIEGHTDNVPATSNQFKDNWELSIARATSVKNFIVDSKIIEQSNCSITGNSEYKPIAKNDTNENKALNRRVDIIIKNN